VLRHISKIGGFIMKSIYQIMFVVLMFLNATICNAAFMAFLEAESAVPVEDESEYKWAKSKYAAVLIFPDGAGKFKDEKGTSVKLSDFSIVWWHRANANTIPEVFLKDAMKDAFLNFAKSGGSVFLSQVALHYVFDLGLEPIVPRFCAPTVDHVVCGIIAAPNQEGHPFFDGFKKMGEDPAKGISINCYGHDNMCDFYPNGPAKGGSVAVMEWQDPLPAWFGQVTPMVEYKVGDGTIVTSGWRLTVFRSGDEGCKFHENMVKLHENVISYLGNAAAVSAKGKLPLTWGFVKKSM
jgi:hypothetical protein